MTSGFPVSCVRGNSDNVTVDQLMMATRVIVAVQFTTDYSTHFDWQQVNDHQQRHRRASSGRSLVD